jgi:hypothetical protein
MTPRLSLVPGGPTAAPMMSPLLTPFMFASFTPQEASRYYMLFGYFLSLIRLIRILEATIPLPGRRPPPFPGH